MLEAEYRTELTKRLKKRFPESEIVATDPKRRQGILDILILIGCRWAMLELKRSRNARHRPNQDYYVDRYNNMSFAAFICPENEEQVLDDLQQTLGI